MASSTPSDRLLRTALLANAAFSTACGLALGMAPAWVAAHIGFDHPWVLRAIGIGLLFFAGDLVYQGTRPRMSALRALGASVGDFGWVAGSVVLLAGWASLFSGVGQLAVVTVAAVVLGCGLAQLLGLSRLVAEPDASRGTAYRHCITVDVDAPADAMWQVVSDLPTIRRYSESLTESFLREGGRAEVGAVRECTDDRGQRWAEEVLSWEHGAFSVRFRDEEPDFPFPVARMLGGWRVQTRGAGSRVTVWWSYTPRVPTGGLVLASVMGARLDGDFPKLLARMADDARNLAAGRALAPEAARPAGLRLIAAPC
jgi:hypothetical protein